MNRTPEAIITAMLVPANASTPGSKYQMNGSMQTPMSAVKTIKTAVSLFLK